MDRLTVKLRVANCERPELFEEFDAEVDPARLFSRVSRPRLERLGVVKRWKRRASKVEGRVIELEFSPVWIAVEGRSAFDSVVIAEDGETEVLGSHSLDAFGFAVDPTRKKLVPTIMLALTAERTRSSLSSKLRARS